MDFVQPMLDIFFHLDTHLNLWATALGPWLYVVLFLIVFCETGLVITPFLPGDSLLFAVGALASLPDSPLQVPLVALLLITAAVSGDAVNYSIGYRVGPKVFTREDSLLFNRRHLLMTQRFYEKHGGKTIFWARFIPIIRTFAPFVAGIGKMGYRRFATFNVTGGIIWILSFLLAGYYFGNLPFIQERFHYVILIIIVLSLMPPFIEWLRSRRTDSAESNS